MFLKASKRPMRIFKFESAKGTPGRILEQTTKLQQKTYSLKENSAKKQKKKTFFSRVLI